MFCPKLRATFIRIFAASAHPSSLSRYRSGGDPICHSLCLITMAKASSKTIPAVSSSQRTQNTTQSNDGEKLYQNLTKKRRLNNGALPAPGTHNMNMRQRGMNSKLSDVIQLTDSVKESDQKSGSRQATSSNKSTDTFGPEEQHRAVVSDSSEMSALSNSTSSSSKIFQTLKSRFEKLRNKTKATAMSKYMRNKFEFFGITSPECKTACADLWKDVKALNSHELRQLATETWNAKEREFHHFAVSLLEREKFNLYADVDLSSQRAQLTLSFVKSFITATERTWWDSVDPLSSNVVGPLVQKYPDDLLSEMDEWNGSNNFWLRRASLIYQLKFREETDVDRLFRYCLQRADEKEFFIQKAIGWSLRQYAKTNPDAVYNFVMKNEEKLSTLSKREALKHKKS